MEPDAASNKAKDQLSEKIHVLNASEVQKRSYNAQRKRRRWTIASFFFFVFAPLLVVIYYYSALAADRYAVETKFAIRSASGSNPADFLGIVSSVSATTSTITDSYIIVDFIESRDLIDRLNKRVNLDEIYNHPQADLLTRLDPDQSVEDIVKYMNRMISVYFDTSSQIITLEVQAFTATDAERVSAAIIEICDALVNEISERARNDAMRSAEKEVARIELQLESHRRAISAFRESQQDIDPTASAGAQVQLLSQLESQLASSRARLESLRGFLSEEAPSVRILKSQIEATERQLLEQRQRLGTGEVTEGQSSSAHSTLTSRVGTYEDLAIDLEFLQRTYFTALASRESARLEADRAQRYLTAFVKPATPQSATYPKRIQNILIFAGFAIMLWGIGVMIVYIVREHSS